MSPKTVLFLIQDYTREMVRRSKECVINIPTTDLLETAVRIGNSTGAETDKFATFGLAPGRASKACDVTGVRPIHANARAHTRRMRPEDLPLHPGDRAKGGPARRRRAAGR